MKRSSTPEAKAYQKAYREKNKERLREQQKRFYQENKHKWQSAEAREAARLRVAEDRKKNPEKHKKLRREFYLRHRSKLLEKAKKESPSKKSKRWKSWYLRNRERLLAKQKTEEVKERRRILALAHSHKRVAHAREKRRLNPEQYRASCQRRRARLKNLRSPGVTEFEWLEILELHSGRCAYCGTLPAPGKKLERDHIIPIARGGLDEPANVVPACRRCNASKGHKLLCEWRRRPVNPPQPATRAQR